MYLQCGNCHALVETADLCRFPLDEYRCYSCLKPFHNKTLTCIWCGYCGEADMFRWAQQDGNCPSCGRSVMRKRGIDQDICPECGKAFYTCDTNCPFCDARQLNTICLVCKHPVAAAPEAQLLTCENCGALRRRFSCASCGKATAVWAPEDRDVWTFNCSACGAAQRITIPQGVEGVDVRRPASASGGRSRS